MKVLGISGSLRKGSFSRKTARAVMGVAPASLQLEIVEIAELPLYNQDDDAHPPALRRVRRARAGSAP